MSVNNKRMREAIQELGKQEGFNITEDEAEMIRAKMSRAFVKKKRVSLFEKLLDILS